MEILSGQPKGRVLAQLAITVKRLPMWIVAEWISRTGLVKRTPNGLEVVEPEAEPDGWDELPDAGELKAALNPARGERLRYIEAHWAHGPNWVEHRTEGD